MQGLSDEQQMERLERKVDEGFARLGTEIEESTRDLRAEILSARSDARDDFRTLVAINLTMVVAMIFGFAGLTVAMLTQM
jgi:hypothetical protein